MNAFGELRDAARGWLDLILARPEGAARFNASSSGIVNAVGFYFAVALVTLLLPAFGQGMPDYSQLFTGIVVNFPPLLGIAAVIWATRRALRLEAGFGSLFVPAAYALGLVVLAGLVLAFVSTMFANSLLGVLGYMYYRLARDIGKMGIGVSIAFAALGIVALVAPSFGLYMLTVPAPSAV